MFRGVFLKLNEHATSASSIFVVVADLVQPHPSGVGTF